MNVYFYKISFPNKKVYIGRTNNMSKRYKNFLQNLKNMNLEDIDITADELNEEEQYNDEEENEFQSPTMGKNSKQHDHKKHKSFRDHTGQRGDSK